MLITILLTLCVMAWRPGAELIQGASNDDVAVYKAILADRIQPEVDRFTAGGGYGWLFLLERRGEAWQVVSVDMLWIS